MKDFRRMRVLYLDSNRIDDQSAIALAASLPYCIELKTLSLNDNLIGDEGIEAIAYVWPQCLKLRSFSHCHANNKITARGHGALQEANALRMRRAQPGNHGGQQLLSAVPMCVEASELERCRVRLTECSESPMRDAGVEYMNVLWVGLPGTDGSLVLYPGASQQHSVASR
jgi:Leucine Rich repeat